MDRNRSENARGDTNLIPHRPYTCIVALADLSNYQTFLTDSSQIKSLYKLLTASCLIMLLFVILDSLRWFSSRREP